MKFKVSLTEYFDINFYKTKTGKQRINKTSLSLLYDPYLRSIVLFFDFLHHNPAGRAFYLKNRKR